MTMKLLQPDSKGRVTLGKSAVGIVGYQRHDRADGSIMLVPMTAIPAREAWLHADKAALESVRKGIVQSRKGQTGKWGSFAKHAKE